MEPRRPIIHLFVLLLCVGSILTNEEESRKGAFPIGQPKMPAIYISKYNRFVDNVIGSINKILGKSYDPVRVKLPSAKTVKNTNKNKKNSNKKKNKKNTRRKTNKRKNNEMKNKMGELVVARVVNEINQDVKRTIESESREPAFVLISKVGSNDFLKNVTVTTSALRARPSNKNKKKNSTTTKNGNKTSTKQSNNNNNNKNKSKVRATLFGLSTIKREGDVIVNMVTDHTNVKTNFVLGPLTLRVEREYGNKGRRELKSATATTAEMFGRLNLKIVHGGAATLQSIRVLQPKQVRVDSADGHDKTREYMWKRSAHIASLVSQKLSSVAKSMLKPPAL